MLRNSGQGEWLRQRFPSAVTGVISATPVEGAPPVAISFLKTDRPLTLGDADPEAAYSLHINRAMIAGLNIRRTRAVESHWLPLHSCSINDLSNLTMMTMSPRFDMIRVYMPVAALEQAARDTTREKQIRLVPPGYGFHDQILANLGATIDTLFRMPEAPPQLLIDHLALCIQVHLLSRYSEDPPAFSAASGGLAGWQLRRVQDILMSRLDEDITLAELASACGLSNRHFSRAFRESKGLAPFQWLAAKRLEIAREMIIHTSLPFNEIARACGYADQSHLARTFKRRFGTTPSDERRRSGGTFAGFVPRSIKD
ncbi:AraC family transcriptional regulator [Mesorhizobium sp. B2-1-8]|uniref:AraC family transcriptional regulator n=1 Tax=Mesorhizobium sp. B2-1-8 TaxID=2589967 RepID=UPI001128E178|nr:AraC family transcriptional regulator [Mesorhizobium sp. B2-1-8]UCI17894.1 AraC family transcriptional regulator [Mesorhizobium sp. B2-1-8]